MNKQQSSKAGKGPDYEDALRRASQRTFEHLERIESDRKVAQNSLSELIALSPRERERALLSESRFHTYSLATQALEHSEQEVSRDPLRAWELARLGHSVVGRIDPRTCGGVEALIDLKAYALAMEGNTLRVRGDFQAALRSFSRARFVQRSGGIDPSLTAAVDLFESSLRRDLWQLDAALALLDRATEVFIFLSEQDRVAHSVLNRANIYNVRGDWTLTASILRVALEWPDSKVTFWARHNLADALVKAGRAPEAAQVFAATRDLYACCTDTLSLNRRLWLEGLIARELGDLQRANDLLEMATESFRRNGYAGDAALAHLDLVVTRKKQAQSRRRKAPLGG